jgi:hypothetical protein
MESRYDELEKKMLTSYFEFARGHKDVNLIYWNRTDIKYRLGATIYCFIVLGSEPLNFRVIY